jgi:hypothetical protein
MRKVYCKDALIWLRDHKNHKALLTSLPELEEMKMTVKDYEVFFREAAGKCLDAVTDDGYCIFMQTDRKHHGLIDKSYWLTDEALSRGFHTVWRKIALKRDVGKMDLFRPTYSYMLCFTKRGNVGKLLPDVVSAGETTYTHGFGLNAVLLCVEYVKHAGATVVVDPFCGSGTTLAVANAAGLDAIGVEISPRLCEKAKSLRFSL